MNCTLQRAGIWKRISAYLLDLILLAILATGAIAGLSAILGYDEKMGRVTQFYQEYETIYGIDFDITEEDYLKLREGESIIGIDVSHWQKLVDWEQVKASGVDFAMIRLGYRGYEQGTLNIDS